MFVVWENTTIKTIADTADAAHHCRAGRRHNATTMTKAAARHKAGAFGMSPIFGSISTASSSFDAGRCRSVDTVRGVNVCRRST